MIERRFYRSPSLRYVVEVIARIDATPLVGVLLVLVTAFLVVAVAPLHGTEIHIPRRLDSCSSMEPSPCDLTFEVCQLQPLYLTFTSETPWSEVVANVDAWKASAPAVPIAFVEETRR